MKIYVEEKKTAGNVFRRLRLQAPLLYLKERKETRKIFHYDSLQ